MRLKALIFDFDGLMVDTESAIYQSWRELYASHGQELPLEIYVQCVGSHAHDYNPFSDLERLTGLKLNREEIETQLSLRNKELYSHLDTISGIRELLADAAAHGVKCAVASSSSLDWVGGWLQQLGLVGFFQEIITRDLVERAKPAPDLFLLAMKRLDVTGKNALVLEDSANGLIAATAANIGCIIVPNEITKNLDFAAAAALLPTFHGLGVRDLEPYLPQT